jgi:hypothetical protein
MRLETGKYLCLDATLAERMTPGHTAPPVGFTVVAHDGLGVRLDGTGTWSKCSTLASGWKAQARRRNTPGTCTGERVLRRNGRVGWGALG